VNRIDSTGRRARLAAALGAAALAAVLLAAAESADGVKKDEIIAAHAKHHENEVPCETCHAGAAASRAGVDHLLPTMETCGGCHDIADTMQCGLCHTRPEDARSSEKITTVAQKFPHATHVDRGMTCGECHGSTAKGEPALPEKALCRSCHETASDGSDCALCHAAEEPLRPISHSTGWLSLHAVDGRVNAASCENCHTQKECQDCHAGDNVRPRVHPLSYVFGHALDARSNELACAACHEDRDFCASCHAAARVLPRDHARADWVDPVSGGRHAEEGRFDMESCMACHDAGTEAPVCADCHGEGVR
jgi:hypothetical protein